MKNKKIFFAVRSAIFMLALICFCSPLKTLAADSWSRINVPGFEDSDNLYTGSQVDYNSELYVGVGNWNIGGGVWKYSGSGTNWAQVNSPGFGDPANVDISAMAVYDDKLYVAVRNFQTEGETETITAQIWIYDGDNWVQDDLGDLLDSDSPNYSSIYSMSVYGDSLYVGHDDENNGAHVLKFDGADWTEVLDRDTLGANNIYIDSMTVFDNNLYLGTRNDTDGMEIWRYDGADWIQAADPGFGEANVSTQFMAAYDNQLYAFTFNSEGNDQVWRYDGADWTKMDTDDVFGQSGYADISAAVFSDKLYVSVSVTDLNLPPEIYTYDGDSWEHLDSSQLSDLWELNLFIFNGNIYGKAQSLDSLAEVWKFTTDQTNDSDDNSSDDISSDEPQKAHIDSWKAYLYENNNGVSCSKKLKLTIKGRHFEEDAEVKIGGFKADSVDRKSSRKIVAKFCFSELFADKKVLKRSVKVINPDTEEEKADKKINLSDIKYGLEEENLNFQGPERTINIQKALVLLKYLDSQYATGFYGPITTEAVRKFQEQNGLPQVGYFGPLTEAKLEEKFK